MKPRTYDEWKLQGYYVRKGELASGVDKERQRTFTIDQCDECDFCFDDYDYREIYGDE